MFIALVVAKVLSSWFYLPILALLPENRCLTLNLICKMDDFKNS